MSGRNCPTCARREKVHGFDGGGGDFWHCTAVPLIPAFTGQFYGGYQQLVNLASFEPDHPCAEYQNAKACPLWQGEPASERRDDEAP